MIIVSSFLRWLTPYKYTDEVVEYEHVDLLVTYQMRLIEPWSQAEIDKAVKLNRLSKFNVLGNAF
ncbi:TPA: hypothetical protein IX620_001082 [Enterococcus faecium]|nr:hypothetical protein [Enterococcus faecium]HAQ7399015.1 hypothetical protein [Enterococcus faecium]HCT5238087.1 hypothetical protein [Enterococcus faecium]